MITDTRSRNVIGTEGRAPAAASERPPTTRGDTMEVSDIDLSDSKNFVDGVPHEWFAYLRREAPVQ